MRNRSVFAMLALLGTSVSSCASTHAKPCTLGGQSSRTVPTSAIIGKKSCDQIVDDSGSYVNDGKYYEWFLDDKIALVGEYKKGKKSGRWIEYDEDGKIVSQLSFEDGKELPPAYQLKKDKKSLSN
jgi:hypothetical protein